jgi:hypothetical protein
MSTAPAESPDLQSAVRQPLGEAGILDWRARWHPGGPGAVAVRGPYLDGYAALLEAAGMAVEDCGGWLTVRAAAGSMAS